MSKSLDEKFDALYPITTTGPITAFEIQEEPVLKGEVFSPSPVGIGEMDNDMARARQNLIELIDETKDSLTEAKKVAKSTEHPRAFEVVADLTRTLSALSMDLMELHKKIEDAKSKHAKRTGEGGGRKDDKIEMKTKDMLALLEQGGMDAVSAYVRRQEEQAALPAGS